MKSAHANLIQVDNMLLMGFFPKFPIKSPCSELKSNREQRGDADTKRIYGNVATIRFSSVVISDCDG